MADYDSVVKNLIVRLKFQHDRATARVAADLILLRLRSELSFDVVTSVPVSSQRFRERGYNQSELVAKIIAGRLRLPYSTFLGRNNGLHQLVRIGGHDLSRLRKRFIFKNILGSGKNTIDR